MLTESDRAGMVRLPSGPSIRGLDYYENRLRQFSVKYDVIPRITGADARCASPRRRPRRRALQRDGLHGNLLPTVNPAPWPEGLKGIAPPRLDHTLVTAPEPPKAIQFFQEVSSSA